MDLGVTMGISLRFKAARPYFWRGKKRRRRIRKTVAREPPQEAALPRGDALPAGLSEAGLGRWAAAGLRLH